jgi:hypothetical protein
LIQRLIQTFVHPIIDDNIVSFLRRQSSYFKADPGGTAGNKNGIVCYLMLSLRIATNRSNPSAMDLNWFYMKFSLIEFAYQGNISSLKKKPPESGRNTLGIAMCGR